MTCTLLYLRFLSAFPSPIYGFSWPFGCSGAAVFASRRVPAMVSAISVDRRVSEIHASIVSHTPQTSHSARVDKPDDTPLATRSLGEVK